MGLYFFQFETLALTLLLSSLLVLILKCKLGRIGSVGVVDIVILPLLLTLFIYIFRYYFQDIFLTKIGSLLCYFVIGICHQYEHNHFHFWILINIFFWVWVSIFNQIVARFLFTYLFIFKVDLFRLSFTLFHRGIGYYFSFIYIYV